MATELREISRRAEVLAARLDSGARSDHGPLADDILLNITPPGAHLRASQSRDGSWWAYLVMPDGWRPPAGEVWMSPDGSNYCWTDAHGATEDEALRLGLIKLIEATSKP